MTHLCNASSRIAQTEPRATNLRIFFANGIQDVTILLYATSNSTILVHICRPAFFKCTIVPEQHTDNFSSDFAKGAHVVIRLLSLIVKLLINVHDASPSSSIALSAADSVIRDFANGAHVVILRLQSTFNSVMDVHSANPSSQIPHL